MDIDFEQEIEAAWEKVRELLEKNPHYSEEDIKEIEEQEKPAVDTHSFIQLLEDGFECDIFGADNRGRWAVYEEDELWEDAVYALVCWEVVKSIIKTALTPYLVEERLSGNFEQTPIRRDRFKTLEREIKEVWERRGLRILEERCALVGEGKYQWTIVASEK